MVVRKTTTAPTGRRATTDTGLHVALLRGVNVGGNKKVPMATLRELAAALGWRDAQTYVQSGNLVFRARGPSAALGAKLERAIATRLGFEVPVIVRGAAEWLEYAKGGAFIEAEVERPKLLHLAFSKSKPPRSVVAALQPYCTAGEIVALRRDALWIDYSNGVARSKLTPAVLDRAVGATVTARNWNTVQALAEMLRGA